MIHEFHLSPRESGRGISCDADGAFIGSVPLLKRLRKNGQDAWQPRDHDEISNAIGERYGLPIDMSSKRGGLTAIANALNEGDVARAQIASVLLGIPDPPPLSKSGRSRDQTIKLIRDLHWSGLLKWDPDEHPRWPAGAADSKGGQFAPKGEDEETGAASATRHGSIDGAHLYNTEQDGAVRNTRIQLADAGMSDAYDDPVAEAARAAAAMHAATVQAQSAANPNAGAANDEHEGFWQALGSRLSHEAKSALSQIGQAQLVESNADLAAGRAEVNAISHVLRDYAVYRAKPWLDSEGRPVEIPAIDIGNPVAGQAELMIRLTAKEPLTRPATNADWIDPLINLASTAAMAAGPAGRLLGPGAEALGEAATGSDILIGNSGFRNIGEFTDAVTAKYQRLYDEGYELAIGRARQGLIANDPLVIGQKTDLFARVELRDWLANVEGIDEGLGQIIQVNRRLYDPLGSGDYRVPDVYVPESRTILDGSLQFKTSSMPQISDYQTFSGGAKVTIIRPSTSTSRAVDGSYGIVH